MYLIVEYIYYVYVMFVNCDFVDDFLIVCLFICYMLYVMLWVNERVAHFVHKFLGETTNLIS